jgi:hypothetical protein
MAVTVAVTMVELVIMKIGLHLYFRVAGWGKDGWLYPPSGWS